MSEIECMSTLKSSDLQSSNPACIRPQPSTFLWHSGSRSWRATCTECGQRPEINLVAVAKDCGGLNRTVSDSPCGITQAVDQHDSDGEKDGMNRPETNGFRPISFHHRAMQHHQRFVVDRQHQ